MKKIVLTLVAMMTITMANAENEEKNAVQAVNAYDMTVNMRKLAVALGLTLDQMEAVQDIHTAVCNDMYLAGSAHAEERKALVDEAVKKDIRYMHYILDEKQYKKYVNMLDLTAKNTAERIMQQQTASK